MHRALETSKFALSDHYALRGVVTLGVNNGASEQPHRPGRLKGHVNMLLGKLCRDEQVVLKTSEMRARQEFLERLSHQQDVGQQLTVKMHREKAKLLEERRLKRKDRWECIFGDQHSFFSNDVFLGQMNIDQATNFVSRCFDFAIPQRVFRSDVGFARVGNTCYVNVVAQVLLRLQPITAMLQKHSEVPCTNVTSCVLCALWDSKSSLGSSRLPRLANDRHLVGAAFADENQHDAVEFLECWIAKARAAEIKNGEATQLPDEYGIRFPEFTATVTSLDSLFLTIEERRAQCANCARAAIDYSAAYVLKLPLPMVENGTVMESPNRVSPQQLYHTFCAREQPTQYVQSCCNKPNYWEQRRHVGRPKVLFMQVRRQANLTSLSRHMVLTTEDLQLDDGTVHKLGNWCLQAVIYHQGKHMNLGHYTCACKASDGYFWYYDDTRGTRLTSMEYNLSQVVLLVYVQRP